MIRMDIETFTNLAEEMFEAINTTTWRGEVRQNISTATPIPHHSFLFFTLFWLSHYPTISLLSALFKIHLRTTTQVLQRTTHAMARELKGEIEFPTTEEMESLTYTYLQNDGFAKSICVVDGTEICISRPAKDEIQKRTYSIKKKQNSLNVMIITKLTSEIIYFSPLHVGAHDQSHWNELELHTWFISKPFGILGDGGFTFN